MKSLFLLFEKYAKRSVAGIYRLEQSGSNRQYFRLFDENKNSVIGVVGVCEKENAAFVKIAQKFENQNIPAPKILAVSDDFLCYLQEDLGEIQLFDEIKNGRESGLFSDYEKELLHKTIACLPDIQFKIAQNFDFSICFPQPEFDKKNIFFDLNYFKYCFLKPVGVEFDEILLENNFEKLSEILLKFSDTDTFMYRDFQSRNVMLKGGKPFFIDFQGGRKGAVYYDVASFLWQAKANFSNELRNELIDTYLENLKKYLSVSKSDFLKKIKYFVLFRQLQTLGAYGFRGLIEKKTHFLQSIPLALENIKKLDCLKEFPHLNEILCTQKIETKYFCEDKNICQSVPSAQKLTVQIESFAYKNGIPQDYSGNGGGYVFDCRSIHNPGKYEKYKNLTGKDEDVKNFLIEHSDAKYFLQNIYSLIDRHLEVFLERRFTHLSVFFGCTGGQHRSVFCAESLAKYLEKYDVNITLKHNELA
jgi:aminoglycoside/choline kinase family phosphotransferase